MKKKDLVIGSLYRFNSFLPYTKKEAWLDPRHCEELEDLTNVCTILYIHTDISAAKARFENGREWFIHESDIIELFKEIEQNNEPKIFDPKNLDL